MQKKGIRIKLVIAFSLIILIVIAIVSVFFILSIRQSVDADVLDKVMLGLLVIIPFIFIFAVLAAYFISGRIAEPIRKLRDAVNLVLKGDLNYQVSVHTHDEIEDLANSFNEIVLNLRSNQFELQRYSQGMEKAVREKIEYLENKIIELKGKHDTILNVANDIDEERQRTIKEKDKINAILHSIGDGVFVVDKDLNVVIVNEIAAEMAGYRSEEILGLKYTERLKFILEETGKINSEFIDKAFETKTVQKMANHTVLVGKDGNRTQVSNSAAPLLDADSKVIGCVVVFRNVTKEREIDKAKSEFVSLASHQLRTPLSVINWYSEMLLDGDAGKLNENQRKYVEEVYKGNQRMVDLVNSLLNVSRLELGTFVVEPEPVDIASLAKGAASDLRPQILGKKLIFREHYGERLPMFSADSKLLRMVFQNLLSNAVKYTPENGEVSIGIDIKKAGEDFGGRGIKEESFAILVSDTGYGITASQQDKIFSKLFRADNVRQKDTEGTGLGLYIVKAVVDLSGGSIWFASEEDKGTTFYITLPVGGMKKKEGTKKLV